MEIRQETKKFKAGRTRKDADLMATRTTEEQTARRTAGRIGEQVVWPVLY
jgi:hypothetical protein